jgi:hypothetical protein
MFDEDEIENCGDLLSMFTEDDQVIIDKGHLSQRRATICYYSGEGYFKVVLEGGEEADVHVFRLTK